MIIVSDTTPLSELAKIGKLDLLQAIFGRVIISQQVYDCLLYTSPSPRDYAASRMPSSA